jgi:hypothetical protein
VDTCSMVDGDRYARAYMTLVGPTASNRTL